MNEMRRALEAGEVLCGTFSSLVEPVWVEMLVASGFDFVVIDCEESPGDSYGSQLDDLVRAAEAAGGFACVRVVENVPGAINRALCTGADGLFIPHVRTADDARRVVEAARTAPRGKRSVSPAVRAHRYGLDGPAADLAAKSDEPVLWLLLEDTTAIGNVEEIVQVPGIDGVMVGTWDLSVELGVAGYGATDPGVKAHVDRVISAGRGAGLFTAGHAWSGEAAAAYVGEGCQVLFVSMDANLLAQGMRELKALADEVEAV